MIDPGGVPQSGNNSGGGDTAALLQQILGSNQSNLADLAKKAATPIPGGHATQFPLSLTPTQKPVGPGPMIPTRGIVGRGNAKAAGIGNAVLGVTHALAATETALDNKKKLEVASATQQLLTAQSAYDQASQLLKQDPTNADAKAAVDRNQNVMNGILSNDKIRKAIAKGMNVDFTDPKANDSIEHAGVAQGKEMAKAHASYAEQFNDKTPTTMAPNTQAQAQYQAAIQQQKIQTDSIKAMVPLLSAQMRAQASGNRDQANLTREQMRDNTAATVAAAKAQNDMQRTLLQIQSRQDLAKSEFGYRMTEINQEGLKDIQVFRQKLEDKTSDPTARLTAFNNYQIKAQTAIARATEVLTQTEKAKNDNPDKTGSSAQNLNLAVDSAKQVLQAAQDNLKANTDLYKLYDKGASNGGNSISGSNSSTTSTNSISSANSYLDSSDDPEHNDDDDD